MILFTLRCTNGHVFEGWFKDSAAYDRQAAAGVVECPQCGNAEIRKAPMAPHIARHGRKSGRDSGRAVPAVEQTGIDSPARTAEPTPPPAPDRPMPVLANSQVRAVLMALRRHVEDTCEHVGERFPEEVRRIHYGETEHRNIYGEASEADADALRDEGIEVARIPWLPRTDS